MDKILVIFMFLLCMGFIWCGGYLFEAGRQSLGESAMWCAFISGTVGTMLAAIQIK